MKPGGRCEQWSFSLAKMSEEIIALLPVTAWWQAHASSWRAFVTGGAAGAAGWPEHQAPEHGWGAGGTGEASDRPDSPPKTSTINSSRTEG